MKTIGRVLADSRITPATLSDRRQTYKLLLPAADIAARLEEYYRLRVQYIGRRDYTDVADIIARVANWLTSETARPGLILSGGVGTGKTTMLYTMRRVVSDCGYTGKMFLASYMRTLFVDNVEQTRYQILQGSWCRYLYLDDIGTDPRVIRDYGNEIRPFVRIVEERYNRGLPIVISTNLNVNDFEAEYDLRTADRLREMCDVITYNGESYRK